MPRITIHENDNTGAEYTGGEIVVFVPGALAIKEGLADNNNCVYISTADYTSLDKFLVLDELDDPTSVKNGTALFICSCLSQGLDVIYCQVQDYGKAVHIGTIDKTTYDGEGKAAAIEKLPTILITLPGKETDVEVEGGNHTLGYAIGNLGFLNDKDTYNVKFLTTGCLDAISSYVEGDGVLQDSDSKIVVKFDFDAANTLCGIAAARTDSTALLSVGYDLAKVKNGEAFATQLREALNPRTEETLKHVLTGGAGFAAATGSYGEITFPNRTASGSIVAGTVTVKYQREMPSVWAYLASYGESLKDGQEWLPLANSTRGSVASMGTSNLTVTKYFMDQNIIKDGGGVSFNGIVNLRPYGDVIWGDRTLLTLTNSVKATAYLSLRNLIGDVSKRAYQAAVRNTYESNNAVTWFNFKARIVDLLGEMVTAGVLSNYSVTKAASPSPNTIVCKITLYPNFPVENFDIYINLENAEVKASDSGESDED